MTQLCRLLRRARVVQLAMDAIVTIGADTPIDKRGAEAGAIIETRTD